MKRIMNIALAAGMAASLTMGAVGVYASEAGTVDAQTINLSGVKNGRQLGGYQTENGRTVKENLLFRTGKLVNATEEDIQALQDLGITKIVDLRTTAEMEADPDPEIEGIEHIQVNIVGDDSASAASSLATASATESNNPAASLVEALENGYNPEDMYIEILSEETSQKGLAEVFRQFLSQPDGEGILWHCTADKDRAGTVSVLLLSALGVDRETALQDFELTNEFIADDIAYMESAAEELTDDQDIIDGVVALSGVNRSYMETALDYLDETYGSVDDYLKDALGLTDDDLAALQAKYLE